MADYIPSGEAAKIRWLSRFTPWFGTYGMSYGFTVDEVCALVFTVMQARLVAASTAEKQRALRAAVVMKRHGIADTVSLVRGCVKRLQADPAMTDADRADAGIAVPDTKPTATDPQAIRAIPRPLLELDWSVPLQVMVHFGFNPHNEHENARPDGTQGVHIQYCRGGIPEHEADWNDLDSDTQSPYIHIVHEDEPTDYAYRVCWVSKHLKRGPYGDPAVCTVSV